MNTMTMNARNHEIAAEIIASLERIQSLLARLGAFDAPEDFHSARDLRLSAEEIRRILARTRVSVSEAPPEDAAWGNARVDEVEAKLDLAASLQSLRQQTPTA